jgi:hypothetical protein
MVHSACTPERKAELLKLIADELIVLDQSRERALLAEQRISGWRAEYDEQAPGPALATKSNYTPEDAWWDYKMGN